MFEDGIKKIIQQIEPGLGATSREISREIYGELDYIIKYLIIKITEKVGILLSCISRRTASTKSIQDIIRITFPCELERGAASEGTKLVMKYNSDKDKPILSLKKINAIFRIAIQDYKTDVRVSMFAIVYLAGVCEYIVGEILYEMEEITVQKIFSRIKGDEELSEVFHGYMVELDDNKLGINQKIKRQIDEYTKNIK